MARTFPTNLSPIDAYSSVCDRPLGYFEMENTEAVTGYPKVVEVKWDVSADASYPTGISVGMEATDDPTIWMARGISIGMDDLGSACADIVGLDIGMTGGDNSPANRHTYCRFRNHSSASQPVSVFLIEGSDTADYLMKVQVEDAPPFIAHTTNSTARTHRIAVNIGGHDGYISVFSA